ncbi:MAG: uncharacterized protein PWP08_1879 [Methanofollis sp.]|nr:uncharacterized protein [Methanofollis sp.]
MISVLNLPVGFQADDPTPAIYFFPVLQQVYIAEYNRYLITMVKLTEEMKTAFSSVRVFPVSTASKDGIPNVAPIGFCMLMEDDTIWIADNFMKKTLANLRENPKVAIYIWGPETKGCFQIKGDVSIVTEGEDFQKMREIVIAKMSQAPAKSLIVVTVTEVFSCTPGPGAGERIPLSGQ